MADPDPSEPPADGAAAPGPGPGPGSKRQRRPSVRLGDIGDPPPTNPHEPYVRRSKLKDPLGKPRPLTNPRPDGPNGTLTLRYHHSPKFAAEDRGRDEVLEPLGDGIRRRSRDVKALRRGWSSTATRGRVRTNWVDVLTDHAELGSSGGEDAGDEGYVENSESLSDRADRRAASETNNRDWSDQNGGGRLLGDDSVLQWLDRLGLGRYASLFKIHEVDDEVLPHLTLEDLRDMGINAVGSRRKMYSAIQKLRKKVP